MSSRSLGVGGRAAGCYSPVSLCGHGWLWRVPLTTAAGGLLQPQLLGFPTAPPRPENQGGNRDPTAAGPKVAGLSLPMSLSSPTRPCGTCPFPAPSSPLSVPSAPARATAGPQPLRASPQPVLHPSLPSLPSGHTWLLSSLQPPRLRPQGHGLSPHVTLQGGFPGPGL